MSKKKDNTEQEMIKMELISKVLEQALDLKVKKMADYGVKVGVHRYGLKGIVFDLARKFYRVENIVLGDKEIKVSDETMFDTFIDIINYAIDGAYFIKMKNDK